MISISLPASTHCYRLRFMAYGSLVMWSLVRREREISSATWSFHLAWYLDRTPWSSHDALPSILVLNNSNMSTNNNSSSSIVYDDSGYAIQLQPPWWTASIGIHNIKQKHRHRTKTKILQKSHSIAIIVTVDEMEEWTTYHISFGRIWCSYSCQSYWNYCTRRISS